MLTGIEIFGGQAIHEYFSCSVAGCIVLLKESTAIREYYYHEKVLMALGRWYVSK